jgi:carboxyl-terminal processing protease
MTIVNVKEDMEKINRDSSTVAKNSDWIKNLKKDIYIAETVNIVNDMMSMQSKVNIGTGMK